MKESIKMEVIKGEDEVELEFEFEEDVIAFILDGKEICKCSYEGNFKDVTERMQEIWGGLNE